MACARGRDPRGPLLRSTLRYSDQQHLNRAWLTSVDDSGERFRDSPPHCPLSPVMLSVRAGQSWDFAPMLGLSWGVIEQMAHPVSLQSQHLPQGIPATPLATRRSGRSRQESEKMTDSSTDRLDKAATIQ